MSNNIPTKIIKITFKRCNIDGGISTISLETTHIMSTKLVPSNETNHTYLVSFEEFKNSISKSGYETPNYEKYHNFVTQLKRQGNIDTKTEAAMFLAQILWESDGLRAKSEYACEHTGCPGVYGTSRYIGQNYYGRGYIQLVI